MRQPWADKIANRQKKFEVRNYSTSYRGELIITSTKSDEYPRSGVTICRVNLIDCKKFRDLTEEEKYQTAIPKDKWNNYNGSYAWELENPTPINQIPVKGQQRIWNLVTDRGDLQDYQVREVPSKDYSKRNVIIVAIIVLAGLLTWIVV